tara:strand:+ start:7312 stop:7752 length:441 start_codon:yes stop_codon:yes gene_type:complete
MRKDRPIHPDFQYHLEWKEQSLIDLFTDLRSYILELYPTSNELLYHTHALTTLFSTSEKMSDGFCMIPIYTNHLNLGFNMGTLLNDPHDLLKGTGKLIRHIPIQKSEDYRNEKVKQLILASIDFALDDMDKRTKSTGLSISKIKMK